MEEYNDRTSVSYHRFHTVFLRLKDFKCVQLWDWPCWGLLHKRASVGINKDVMKLQLQFSQKDHSFADSGLQLFLSLFAFCFSHSWFPCSHCLQQQIEISDGHNGNLTHRHCQPFVLPLIFLKIWSSFCVSSLKAAQSVFLFESGRGSCAPPCVFKGLFS